MLLWTERLAFLILIAMATLCPGGELLVLPVDVVVSPDYPARVVVLEEKLDGSVVDVTRSQKLQWRCGQEDSSIGIQVRPDGLIEVAESTALKTDRESLTMHASLGSKNASLTVRVLTEQKQPPTFPREVMAVLSKSGCNLGTCHGNLHGKAGFRLSLRGDDAFHDYVSIVRGAVGRRINRLAPTDSLLLRKPMGEIAHQGGVRFDANSTEAKLLSRWIADGCKWNSQTGDGPPGGNQSMRAAETLESLNVFPKRALLAHDCRSLQLVVIAKFKDGSQRDVTCWSRFEPSVVTGVDISPAGLVHASEPVDFSISVSYLNGRAASRLTFLAHESSEWNEPPPDSRVDELVERQLKQLQLHPEPDADDYVFVRRAYLAIVGRMPTAEEVRSFSTIQGLDKHSRLVELLLHDSGNAYMWAMRWSDLLRNEQKVMSDRGAAGWHAWMVEQIASDRPLTEFVSEMLTTLGSTYEQPAASFHRTHRDPETAAESIGQVFLGVRLQCARCHNHPFDRWRQDDYYGLAAFFTTLTRKQVDNAPKDKFDKHIISGDEIISITDKAAEIWHPGRAATVRPKALFTLYSNVTTAEHPQGAGSVGVDTNHAARVMPLKELANWLTDGNRMFARNMANRIWFHYMGVGIVDPPDDFRDSNPPSNPELLDYLTDELIQSNYSTRHVARLILNSRAFKRLSASEPSATEPLGGPRVFAGYPMRRMQAELLFDAVCDATGVPNPPGEPFNTAMAGRAVARVEVPTKAGFLSTFGKPGRLLVCECERSTEVSLGQSLVLVNGIETREKLGQPDNRLSNWASDSRPILDVIDEIFLTTLSRPPRAQERESMVEYVKHAESRRSAIEDVVWALLNSKEFPLIR